jgi:Flp pilus assembly protein TadG
VRRRSVRDLAPQAQRIVATTARRRRRTWWRLRGRDDGAGTVELVIATPLLLLLLLLVVQFAVWAHATHLAQAAANQALQTARVYQATAGQGGADGQALLAQAGGTIASSAITVDRSADTVTVTVTGTAMTVVPFLHPPIRVVMTGPTERLAGGP